MQLEKFLSKMNFTTRKKAKKFIADNNILINGKAVEKKQVILKEGDLVKINDLEIIYQLHYLIMLNKPKNYLCANHDDKHQTVFDLLPKHFHKNFHIVGRLDLDTTGLVLISNDGSLTHEIISPRKKIYKKYYVETKFPLKNLEVFKNGITLKDFTTKDAKYEIIDEKSCYLSIYEGKFHQVKRMFHYINNEVVNLKRVKIGNLELDVDLGNFRILTKKEINSILEANNENETINN